MEQIEKAELIQMASGTDEEQQKVMQYCYNLIERMLRKYIDMEEEYFPLVTLWIMGTYVHKHFNSYSYLYLNASAGCLPKGTLIKTPTGDKPIEEVTEVLSFNFKKFCVEPAKAICIPKGLKNITRLYLKDNETIECSPEHRWFVDDCSETEVVKEAANIDTMYDSLYRLNEEKEVSLHGIDILGIKHFSEKDVMFDLEVEGNENFFLANGILSHNSGKSRLLKLISSMSKNGEVIIDPTEASTYRNSSKRCNCIDEFEDMDNEQKKVIRKLLNQGYKKGGIVERQKEVSRGGMKEYVTEKFDAYAPYAMANISGINEIVKTRSISLLLEKSNDPIITRLLELEGFNGEYRDILEVIGAIRNLTTEASVLFNGWNDYTTNHVNNPKLQLSSDKRCIDVECVGEKGWGEKGEKGENEKDTLINPDKHVGNYMGKEVFPINSTHSTLPTLPTTTTPTTPPTEYTLCKHSDIPIINFYNIVYNSNIKGRYLELFFPLLFLAYNTSEELFKLITSISEKIVKEDKIEAIYNNIDVIVLDFLNRIKGGIKDEFALSALFSDFRNFYGDSDKRFNVIWFGNTLKRLKVIANKRRAGEGMIVTIDFEKVIKRFEVYQEIGMSDIYNLSSDTPPKVKERHQGDAKTVLMNTFNQLASESPKHDVLHEEWYSHFKDNYTPMEFDRMVDKMLREALIYTPRNGYYQPI